MMTKEEISQKLRGAGLKDEEIEGAIADVMHIVLGKALGSFIESLPESTSEKMKGLSAEDLIKHIQDHKTELPELSAKEFERIYDETWDEYFQAMA